MVSNCINPECRKPFLYLRDGRLYVNRPRNGIVADESQIEYFWLCDSCTKTMSLVVRNDGSLCLVPRDEDQRRSA